MEFYTPALLFIQHLPHSALQPSNQFGTEGVPERGMGDDGRILKEAGRADTFCTVDHLGGEYEVTGSNLFAEGTNCGEG